MQALPFRQFLRVAHFKDSSALCKVVDPSEPFNAFVDWALQLTADCKSRRCLDDFIRQTGPKRSPDEVM